MWVDGALAPNGTIYCMPAETDSSESSILEINTTTDSATLSVNTFLNVSSYNDTQWTGSVLTPNGKIYGIPNSGDKILELDTVTSTVTLIQFSNTNNEKWSGGVLAPNGKIYAVPWISSSSLLEIDPSNPGVAVKITFSNGTVYINAILAQNGKIYGIPYSRASNENLFDPPQTYILEFRRTYPQILNDWILFLPFN